MPAPSVRLPCCGWRLRSLGIAGFFAFPTDITVFVTGPAILTPAALGLALRDEENYPPRVAPHTKREVDSSADVRRVVAFDPSRYVRSTIASPSRISAGSR